MTTIKVTRRELMILLHHLVIASSKPLLLKDLFSDLPLGTLSLEPMAVSDMPSRQIHNERLRRLHGDAPARVLQELGDVRDLRDALVAAGAVPFANLAEVLKRLDDLDHALADPHRHPRPTYLAPDTNLLYHSFFSRTLARAGVAKRGNLRFAIPDLVIEEVDRRIHDKFSAADIEALKRVLPDPKRAAAMLGGSGRACRKAKAAFNEVQYLESNLHAQRVHGGAFQTDKERRDREIANVLGQFARRADAEVVLLTADLDMAYHARAVGIPCEVLRLPRITPARVLLPGISVVDFLFDTALHFGALAMGPRIELRQLWPGKGPLDYEQELIEVDVRYPDGLGERVERDVEIARGVGRGDGNF